MDPLHAVKSVALDVNPGSSLTRWVASVMTSLIALYALWWLADLERLVLAGFKIVMESLLPSVFSVVKSVTHAAEGGWKITTTLSPVDDTSAIIAIGIAPVFLNKCVIWIPAALALVAASAPKRPKTLGWALALILLSAVTTLFICLAAHLAVTINGTPAVLDDDILPLPPNFPINASPFPIWYFHLITFANYLVVLVAPLALPIVIWLIACHRDVRALIGTRR